MSNPSAALAWRPLGPPDLRALTDLASVCLSADGGQPFAASQDYLGQWYLSGAETLSGWDGSALVAATSVRTPPAGAAGADQPAVTTGMVRPDRRRRGLGEHAFDWATAQAGSAVLRAETEALSDGAHALYLGKGLAQVFAEDVMQLAGSVPLPATRAPGDLTVAPWGQADPARFYAVYTAAFRDRPGFPGWSQERWIDWLSDDDDFRQEWTLLATAGGADVGYIAGEASGWITQMGVVPSARGKDVGARLITETVRMMRAAGQTTSTLNVNVDNPHAIALYRRMGFTRTGRRAKYQA